MADETGNLLLVEQNGSSFTARAATGETVHAGAFVKSECSDDVVDSTGVLSLADGDILVSDANDTNDNALVVGVAGNDATAGNLVNVMRKAIIICEGNTVTAGAPVVVSAAANKAYTVKDATQGTDDLYVVGRALTGTSADDKYCVVLLNM